jgi:hypothetical protein
MRRPESTKKWVGVPKLTFHSTPSPPLTPTTGLWIIPRRRLSQTPTTAISTSSPMSLQGTFSHLPALDTITQDDKKAKSKSVHQVSSIPTPTLSKKPRVSSNDVCDDYRLQQELVEEVFSRVFTQKPSTNYLDQYLDQDFLRHIQIQHPAHKLGFRLQPPLSNFRLSSYMSTFQLLDTVDDGPKVTGQ